jgi:hypothetical protein
MNEITKVNGNEAVEPTGCSVGDWHNGLAKRYEDQLVKQGDRWLFKTRKVHFDLMGDMT